MGSWYNTRKVEITRVFSLHRVWECRTPNLRLPVLQEKPLSQISAFCNFNWDATSAEDSVAKCFEKCAIEAVGSVCQVNNLSHSEPHLDAYLLSDLTSQRLLSTAGSRLCTQAKNGLWATPPHPEIQYSLPILWNAAQLPAIVLHHSSSHVTSSNLAGFS